MGGGTVWITVGEIGTAHGVRGELRLRPETDFPERLVPGRRVFLQGPEPRWAEIAGARPQGRGWWLLRLSGVDDRDTAMALRGYLVQVPSTDLPPLPEGQYYHHQIVGLEVVDESGRSLGRVESVERTGANDVYVVRPAGGRTWLLPAIRDVVRRIDPGAGRIEIRLMAGLYEPEGRGRE